MREIREGSPVQGVRAPRGLHLRPTLQQETQVRPTQVRPNLLRRTSLLTRPHTVFVLRRAQSPFVTKYSGKDLKMLLMLMWFAQQSCCCHCYVTILFVFIEWTIFCPLMKSKHLITVFDSAFKYLMYPHPLYQKLPALMFRCQR